MLCLQRKPGESIIIGLDGAIKIVVQSINGNQVKLAIEAPSDVPIHREEIYDRLQLEGGVSSFADKE